jgi:endonuclease-8
VTVPEGHTIHRAARDLARDLCGAPLTASSPQGRFALGAARLDGQRIERFEAHGKHLFAHLQDGAVLHVHLGLYGRFRKHASPAPAPRGAIRLRLAGEERSWDLIGPTACELLDRDQLDALHARLGADPLRQDADPDWLYARLQRGRSAIGSALLDQKLFAGVGNVYRAELLFVSRLHPERRVDSLTRKRFDELWDHCVKLLAIGVRLGRIVTVDPAEVGQSSHWRLRRDQRLYVYKRERCRRCEGRISVVQQAARTLYFCPRCQRR